ncbi:uncharacterized protein LOC119108560 [Pollicipes pollicipes]|uniref:uncharacterized protein LOC119108560 n=1 Tax=Pollicipes pollicipes TaxID=41117 RepID=UPI0018850521|nr:uncharacterized protein LOC119108560 [Pollicipes pollicipes]
MASLTKGQLINELVNHGVEPPPPNARKEKLVKMYEQHVSHFQEAAGEFSSDEEGMQRRTNGDQESVSSLSTDLTELNNDQLSQQLRSHGISVGPIVGSTRRLYEKKLAKLLGREGAATQRSTTTSYNTRTVTVTNGAGGGEDEYSDSEPEEAPVRLSQVAATARGGGGGGGGGGELRQRHAPDDNAYGYSYYKTSRVADAAQLNPRSPALRPVFLRSEDDQPTPRRGVRDVRGSYPREQYLLTKTAVDSYASGRAPVGGGGAWDLDSKADSAGWLRPLVKLCVLLLLIAVAYLGYQNYDDAPSFQSLQDAARDAVHKASEKVSSLRQKTDA